jgi:hypothetical protein
MWFGPLYDNDNFRSVELFNVQCSIVICHFGETKSSGFDRLRSDPDLLRAAFRIHACAGQ